MEKDEHLVKYIANDPTIASYEDHSGYELDDEDDNDSV